MEFESSKSRRKWVNNRTRYTKKYLERKGLTDKEDVIAHCIKYLEFLTGVKQTRREFTWFKFHVLNRGFANVFAYFTKEQLGWDGATVPKEEYKNLFE